MGTGPEVGGNGSPAQREITEGPNQPARARRPAIMFRKEHLDALFGELRRRWQENPEYDRLSRDAHLGIALFDAGRPLGDHIDPRVAELIDKHKLAA